MDIIIIIIDDYYFDVTYYANTHPGGKRILKKFHLKDATDEFNQIKGHGDDFAISELDKYCVGPVKDIHIDSYMKETYNDV